METVILSVRRADLDWSWDLELPSDLPMMRLAPMMARALRWPVAEDQPMGGYQVEAQPPHRPLMPQDTLGGAGVWDGAWLTFFPGVAVQGRTEIEPPTDSPSRGWRRLDGGTRPPEAPPPARQKLPGGFAWKQVDD